MEALRKIATRFLPSVMLNGFRALDGSKKIRRRNLLLIWFYLKNVYLNNNTQGKRMIPTGMLLSLPFFWAKSDSKNELSDVLLKSDQMYLEYLIDALEDYLKANLEIFPNNVEILWRLARVSCEKGKLAKSGDERKKLMYQSLSYVEKALKEDENNFAVHKWYAIILDYVGKIEGTKERIKKSYIIKEHFEKAVQLNKNDPTSWHLLGVWHFTFADLPWYQRKAASVVFATPPTSTYEQALEFFEKAETISPNFYSQNLLMLGKTYLKLNKKDLAKAYLQRAINHVCVTKDDLEAHDEAENIMKQNKWNIN